MRTRSVAAWVAGVIAVLSLGSAPAQAQMVGPLANTTVGNARLIVPDGSSLRQSISTGETRWFVFGAEPGKTYVVEAVDPDSDLVADTIGALHVYAADGTTTPPPETNVDCTASTRAPALEVPVAVDGMRCVVRAFPPSPGNTQNKRGLYVAVGSVSGPSFAIRVRESTIYGRWTTNGYDFHVELENTTGDAMCAQVMFLPNSGNSYAGTWSGAVTTQTLAIPAFGANKLVFPNGTLVGSDNRGTLRIGACSSPVNLMPSGLHVSTYAFNPGIGQYLYFFTTTANNGATSNSWSAASGSGGGSLGGSGTAGFLPLWTGATTLANSVVSQNNGNVGIGVTLAPLNQLQVGDTPGFSANQLALGNGAQAMSFALTPAASIWYGNTGFSLQSTVGDAHAGIGGVAVHNLDVFGGNAQIGLVNTSNGTSATISKYTNRMEISPIDAFQVSVGGLANPHFWIGSNGNVGVGTTSPASKLQIGSVGATGYSGNDIAFGNGTQASGIAQTASVAQWASTTDIALMPRGNGHGRVGINAQFPQFPLDVADSVALGPFLYVYFNDGDLNLHQCPSCIANISIRAETQILANEFDAFSDVRIKDIAGVSNAAHDLATLTAIEITDYALKDKAKYGNKPFKKVIGQQVEKVYPQVVSQHVDFIPNVYRTVRTVTKTAAGTLLHFDNAHGLSSGAKRLKLLTSGDHTMQQVDIVSIPSARDVVIDAPQLNADKVFVYGEEVNDFRTVDYEGLTTLNISATQEIAKRLAKQQADFAALTAEKDAQVAELREQLAKQQARVAELESLAADMSEIRAQVAALKRNATAAPWHDAALRP